MKEEIIKLRKQGKSYKEIAKELNCKKSLVSYHCRTNGLGGVKTEKLEEAERNSRNYQRVKNRRQVTKEKAIEDAKKYTSKSEWQKNSNGALKAARRNGWLEECCQHMFNKNTR